jgi:hypothetical protein
MNTLLKPLHVREALLNKKVRTFTMRDFENIFRTSPTRTKYFLETQTDEGLLVRLKRSIYALKTDLPSAEEIANSLYRPSYISFEYALAYWGIIPEMPYAVTSATTKPTRNFIANERAYIYLTIRKEAYTGYRLVKTNRRISLGGENLYLTETKGNPEVGTFLMAEPEKALADYLYFVSLGKKTLNDRLFIEPGTINKTKLIKYAELYNRKNLMELVKDIV